jgi:SAM-dependent methyltransferase
MEAASSPSQSVAAARAARQRGILLKWQAQQQTWRGRVVEEEEEDVKEEANQEEERTIARHLGSPPPAVDWDPKVARQSMQTVAKTKENLKTLCARAFLPSASHPELTDGEVSGAFVCWLAPLILARVRHVRLLADFGCAKGWFCFQMALLLPQCTVRGVECVDERTEHYLELLDRFRRLPTTHSFWRQRSLGQLELVHGDAIALINFAICDVVFINNYVFHRHADNPLTAAILNSVATMQAGAVLITTYPLGLERGVWYTEVITIPAGPARLTSWCASGDSLVQVYVYTRLS